MFHFRHEIEYRKFSLLLREKLRWTDEPHAVIWSEKDYAMVVKKYGLEAMNDVYKIIDQNNNTLDPLMQSWMVKIHSNLYENLENFITRCHENGIISYFQQQDFEQITEKLEDPNPQVLTMPILSAGFLIWLAAVGSCCVVFVIELLVFRRTSRSHK